MLYLSKVVSRKVGRNVGSIIYVQQPFWGRGRGGGGAGCCTVVTVQSSGDTGQWSAEEVTSDKCDAGDYQWNRLGVFQYQYDAPDGRPVYFKVSSEYQSTAIDTTFKGLYFPGKRFSVAVFCSISVCLVSRSSHQVSRM